MCGQKYSISFTNDDKIEEFYGQGNKDFIMELIRDYTVNKSLYGNNKVTFVIKRLK